MFGICVGSISILIFWACIAMGIHWGVALVIQIVGSFAVGALMMMIEGLIVYNDPFWWFRG